MFTVSERSGALDPCPPPLALRATRVFSIISRLLSRLTQRPSFLIKQHTEPPLPEPDGHCRVNVNEVIESCTTYPSGNAETATAAQTSAKSPADASMIEQRYGLASKVGIKFEIRPADSRKKERSLLREHVSWLPFYQESEMAKLGGVDTSLIRTNLRVGRQSFWTLCQPRVRGYRLAGSSVSIQNLNRDRRQLEVGGHKGPSELEVSPTFNSHLPVAPSCVANVLFQNRMSASPIGVRTACLLFWSSRPNFGLAATKVVQSLYSTRAIFQLIQECIQTSCLYEGPSLDKNFGIWTQNTRLANDLS